MTSWRRTLDTPAFWPPDPPFRSGVDRGLREHKGSLRGYPQKGVAVFSWLLSLAVLVLCVISPLKLPSLNSYIILYYTILYYTILYYKVLTSIDSRFESDGLAPLVLRRLEGAARWGCSAVGEQQVSESERRRRRRRRRGRRRRRR